MCSIIVNKFSRVTSLSISPGLINKVHGIYISFPWFRFTHMDLALRVLIQTIFDQIRLTFSVAIETIEINKLLVSPNERSNNIILERTIEYNTTQPQSSTAKESNATSEIDAQWKKDLSPHGLLTCSCLSQVIAYLSYGTCLLAWP